MGDEPAVPGDIRRIKASAIEVDVWTFGARLLRVRTPDPRGRWANIVLQHDELSRYLEGDHGYFGATIGRYANRISQSSITIDDDRIQLASNEGPHQLHGGPVGFDQRVWDLTDVTDRAVAMRLESPEGDQGFPAQVVVDVTFSVVDSSLRIETVAKSDSDTVFGTTNHAYWNLAGAGRIDDHVFTSAATGYVEVDHELIPTGRILPLGSGSLTLSHRQELGELAAVGGIDHCLVFHDGVEARLAHPPSGRVLTLRSSEPGLQLYTGQYLREPFTGVCLEPQQLPDTPNNPQFGSSLLRAGETYRHEAAYECSYGGGSSPQDGRW